MYEIKSSILDSLAYDKLIIDLTNPEENELTHFINRNGVDTNTVLDDFIDQYINIEKIKKASFTMNFLIQIPRELFRKLLFIKNLNIFDYSCYLEANDFNYLENLVHLQFIRDVQEIRPNAFKGLNNLVYLNLNYCYLSYLDEGCFDGLINLKFLNLQSNLLSEIRDCVFTPLKKLIHLDLSQSDIKKEVNLNGLESLRYLHINSPKLFKLEFYSSNDLLSIDALNFKTILTSHRIDTVGLNYVQEFDKCCFEYLNSLDYLDIRLNDRASLIDNIEEDHFKEVNNLNYFGIESSFANSTSFSIKEPIFEKLIKVNENLEVSRNSKHFLSYVSDYKSDPLEYVNVSDELRASLDFSPRIF
ncbi:unnamed protein product [Brachionus calyciflorus]|uniref:Uncharacterized protein n=1 Tax=Brachionus calyciflorus TaxID=104777 RepID=A0A813XUG9_9BILA|nr:unnamed protein product [Brachionus calyciflorus]